MTSTPDNTRYAELIARLESATGPDRELDAQLECIIAPSLPDFSGLRPDFHYEFEADGEKVVIWVAGENYRRKYKAYSPSHYTSSIDAALSLVDSEHWAIDNLQIWKGVPSRLRLVPVSLRTEGGTKAYWSTGYGIVAEAATAPLALCIAALHARAT